MKTKIMAFCLCFAAIGCQNEQKPVEPVEPKPTTEVTTPAPTTPATPAASTFDMKSVEGTFAGILPCADCEGIKTELMLHADGTYMLSETYLGKKDKPFEGQGKWTASADGKTIEIVADAAKVEPKTDVKADPKAEVKADPKAAPKTETTVEEKTKYMLVSPTELKLLDMEGKEITDSKANLSLKKK